MSFKNHKRSTTLAFVRTIPKSLAPVAYDEKKEGTHWNSQGDEQRVAICKCMGEERRQTGRNVMADSETVREREEEV